MFDSLPTRESVVDVNNPRAVWLTTGAHAINEFYSVALPPIIPLLVTDLSISYAQAGGLLTVFFVMYSLFQLPAGWLADRVGQKGLLAGGMAVLAAGIFLSSLAVDYRTLVVAQALAGLGGATYHPTGMSLISDLESGGTAGKAMGIHGLGGVVGTALAPAIIGGIAVVADWRAALAVAALVGMLYTVTFLLLFSDPSTDEQGETPVPNGGTPGLRDSDSIRELVSRFVDVPLEWWVVVLFTADFLAAFELGAIRTYATSYLFARVGESAAIANAGFFVMLVGGGVSSLGAGHLADRFDRRWLGFGTLLLSGTALALTYALPPNLYVLLAWFFMLGLIVYAIFPAINAITAHYSSTEFSGSLFGVMLTAGSLGSASGALVFGYLAETAGIAVAFPSIAAISLVSAAVFLALFRV